MQIQPADGAWDDTLVSRPVDYQGRVLKRGDLMPPLSLVDRDSYFVFFSFVFVVEVVNSRHSVDVKQSPPPDNAPKGLHCKQPKQEPPYRKNVDLDTLFLRSSKPHTICCGHDFIDIQGQFSYTSFHKESSYIK